MGDPETDDISSVALASDRPPSKGISRARSSRTHPRQRPQGRRLAAAVWRPSQGTVLPAARVSRARAKLALAIKRAQPADLEYHRAGPLRARDPVAFESSADHCFVRCNRRRHPRRAFPTRNRVRPRPCRNRHDHVHVMLDERTVIRRLSSRMRPDQLGELATFVVVEPTCRLASSKQFRTGCEGARQSLHALRVPSGSPSGGWCARRRSSSRSRNPRNPLLSAFSCRRTHGRYKFAEESPAAARWPPIRTLSNTDCFGKSS